MTLRTRWLLLAALSPVLAASPASAMDDPDPDPWIDVGFVIVRSTTDYAEALRVVERAHEKLGFVINLRGLVHDATHGLTWPKAECDRDPLYPFPCYFARGRFDPGVYLSIERSDAYRTFRSGYFVIIAASGEPASADLEKTLKTAKSLFPDA
jgi:hypothetical protein